MTGALAAAAALSNWKTEPCDHLSSVRLYRGLDGDFVPDTNEDASRGFVVLGLVVLAGTAWLQSKPDAYAATILAWLAIHIGSHDLCSPKCPDPSRSTVLGPAVFFAYMATVTAVASFVVTAHPPA